MNCTRCFARVHPEVHNTEELSLQYLDMKVRLNKLNCVNCKICVYLKLRNDKWVGVDSISRENNSRRNGWEVVEAQDELIKFYILSQVIYNEYEGRSDTGNAYFDFPDENDLVKILWEHGRAIGFYTVKRKESIVFETMESYAMTTLDTAYILKPYRKKGFGVSMLEDVVKTFPEEDIAFSTPISVSMCHVILKFLSLHPGYHTKLWEISGVGSEGNRKLVYFTLKKLFETRKRRKRSVATHPLCDKSKRRRAVDEEPRRDMLSLRRSPAPRQ